METQPDSLDISQLKARALGATNDHMQREAPLRALSTNRHLNKMAVSTRDQHKSAGRLRSPSRSQQLERAAPRRSQVDLPTTIPDSSRNKMHTQSSLFEGDTQQLSPSVYDAEISKEQKSTASGPRFIPEGETGHIDLGLRNFVQEASDVEEDTMIVEDHEDEGVDLLSQDVHAEIYPETMRFQPPETPLAQGTKRKRAGPASTPRTIETPRLPVNPFLNPGSANDMMRPSQMFNATQAQTSPRIILSDGLYQRPSPNVHTLGRPVSAGNVSSPAMARSIMSRPVSEPQTKYISVKESQEARERTLRDMHLDQEDSSDDEFRPPSHSQPQRRVDRDQIAKGAKNQLPRKTPPLPKPGQRPSIRNKAFLRGNKSPMQSGRKKSEALLISDDPPADEMQGNITEEETEREDEKEDKCYDDDIDELAEDNKENVEVPRTISRVHCGAAQVVTSQSSPSVQRIASAPRAHSATQIRGSPRTRRPTTKAAEFQTDPQPWAVRDSQSSQQHSGKEHRTPSVRASASGPQSSLDSRNIILQSQLSQKSRSSVPSSSMPAKTATGNALQPLSSSPPSLDGSQFKIEGERNSSPGNPTQLQVKYQTITTTTEEAPQSGVHPGAEKVLVPARTNQSDRLRVSDILESTMSETSLTNRALAAPGKIVPNSSHEVDSSRPTPPSASKAATTRSSNGPSLGTTPFETAREEMSISSSNDRTKKVQRKIPSSQSSPSRNLRITTLEDITKGPSPSDPIQNVDLDFTILSNDDLEDQRTLRMSSRTEPMARKRQFNRSTKWKISISDLVSHDQGTPVKPTSSAISALTPTSTSSEVGPSTSSLRSESPPSPHHGDISVLRTVADGLDRIAEHVEAPPSNRVPSPQLELQAQSKSRGPTRQKSPREEQEKSHQAAARPRPATEVNREPAVIAPGRVFAHFNGQPSAFYTATCLKEDNSAGPEPRYIVRFDEGQIDTISAFGVKRLELRNGDAVKLDLPGKKSKIYVVDGMQDKQAPSNKEVPVDIYGYAKVLLSPKQREHKGANEKDDEQIAVPLWQVYFTHSMWTHIKHREYTHIPSKPQSLSGLQTPCERPSTPSTPSSRTRRPKPSTLTHSNSMANLNQGLFGNMVFTLTNIHKFEDLERAKSLILSNGGKVLEEGFDSLFHVPPLHRLASPQKPRSSSSTDQTFQPTRAAQTLGFTCLIADRHCRRAKYIQALALGIPCLATRWITDCISKQRILPWSAYLLPAGASAFLNDTVRSRVLPSFSAETATLSTIVDQRPRMLDGASILLIMSKNEEETMRQHPLLTFAMGPAKVARAVSVEAAAKAVAEAQAVGEPWDWVFSYDREGEVERVLFGGGGGGGGRKRKGRSGDVGKRGRTRVVNNEYVIQSLILGQLVEE